MNKEKEEESGEKNDHQMYKLLKVKKEETEEYIPNIGGEVMSLE